MSFVSGPSLAKDFVKDFPPSTEIAWKQFDRWGMAKGVIYNLPDPDYDLHRDCKRDSLEWCGVTRGRRNLFEKLNRVAKSKRYRELDYPTFQLIVLEKDVAPTLGLQLTTPNAGLIQVVTLEESQKHLITKTPSVLGSHAKYRATVASEIFSAIKLENLKTAEERLAVLLLKQTEEEFKQEREEMAKRHSMLLERRLTAIVDILPPGSKVKKLSFRKEDDEGKS